MDSKNKVETPKEQAQDDANRDPLSGRAGAHPVGAGVGAAVGGAAVAGATAATAAATGASIGVVGGPVGIAIGTAVGAVVGGVIGGLAGKGIAEHVNPTVEHGFWRENYATRPYVDRSLAYDQYGPAYQYGWENEVKNHGRNFDEVEPTLRTGWDKAKGSSTLAWDRARDAARDSWKRVHDRTGSATRAGSDTSAKK